MLKSIKRLTALSFLGLGLLCFPFLCQAQGSYTAASCNQSDVKAVINGPTHTAVDGDTIKIPAGSCTWTSGISVPSNIGISVIGSGTRNSNSACSSMTQAGCGAGTANTVITINANGVYAFQFSPKYGNSLTHLELIDFEAGSGMTSGVAAVTIGGTCTTSGCPSVRMDNLIFGAGWAAKGLSGAGVTIPNNVFGVYDHNTVHGYSATSGVVMANTSHSAWQGVGQYGDNSWAQPDTLGTNQALFFENNAFDNSSGAMDTDASVGGTGNIGGARMTCRFNYFAETGLGGDCLNHGTETTGRPRGGRQMEAYNNYFVCVNTSNGCPSAVNARSGVIYAFDNVYLAESGSWFNYFLSLNTERSSRGPFTPWNTCDGSGAYDKNDGGGTTSTVYSTGTVTTSGTGVTTLTATGATWNTDLGSGSWAAAAAAAGNPYSIHNVTQNFGAEISASTSTTVTLLNSAATNPGGAQTWNNGDSYQIMRAPVCADQPTRGQSNYISGGTPSTGWVSNAPDPAYEWGDTVTGSYNNKPFSTSNKVIPNRDYYQGVSSPQSSPTSPFNGTSGVGWGTKANRPASCAQGVGYWATDEGNWNNDGSGGQGDLYICGVSGWPSTPSYTPYTYPHPLVAGGGSTSGGNVNPPTGLVATVQ